MQWETPFILAICYTLNGFDNFFVKFEDSEKTYERLETEKIFLDHSLGMSVFWLWWTGFTNIPIYLYKRVLKSFSSPTDSIPVNIMCTRNERKWNFIVLPAMVYQYHTNTIWLHSNKHIQHTSTRWGRCKQQVRFFSSSFCFVLLTTYDIACACFGRLMSRRRPAHIFTWVIPLNKSYIQYTWWPWPPIICVHTYLTLLPQLQAPTGYTRCSFTLSKAG